MAEVPQFAIVLLEQLRAAGLDQLLERHWAEVAHFKDIPLEVDWEAYAAAEVAGRLRLYTARIAGELVGYCAYFVNFNPHYKSSLQAVQDVIFLAPEHRNASVGGHLLLFSEGLLRAEGVQVVYQHSKARADLDMGPLLKRRRYELVDTIWAKRLDRS